MKRQKNIIRKIVAFLCLAAMLVTALPTDCTVEAATKVSAGEKSKVKKKIQAIEDYLGYCVYLNWNSKNFKFDNKRKTDMAMYYVSDEKWSQYEDDTSKMYEKYNCYAGGYKYSKKTKSLIKQSGKKLFGNSYKLALETEKKNEYKPYLYPLTSDKKYIKMNACDWGDYDTKFVYKSITKSSGGYIVKLKGTEYCVETPTGRSKTFTIKLKKRGKSLIISDIKMK